MVGYAKQVSHAKGIGELKMSLQDVMRDIRAAQSEALHSLDQMEAARQEVQDIEARIHAMSSRICLVKVVKDTIRAKDIIARFGGKELMVPPITRCSTS